MLLNSKGIPISERLVFIKHPSTDQWEIITDKKEYGKREKVKKLARKFSSFLDNTNRPPKNAGLEIIGY